MKKEEKGLSPFIKRRYLGVPGLDGSYSVQTKEFVLQVEASRVDLHYLVYTCPLCSNKHRHGSGGER